MIEKLLFDDWDPWITELRRDSRGRFAGGGGGGGGKRGRISAGRGIRKRASYNPTKRVSKNRLGVGGTHTQVVRGRGAFRNKKVKVQSRTVTVKGTKRGTYSTAYVYKIRRGGRLGKAPSRFVAHHAVGRRYSSRYKPGTPAGSKNVRYLTRGHIAGRVVPSSVTAGVGRGLSKNAIRRAKNGKPIAPGYVVSYGAPLP